MYNSDKVEPKLKIIPEKPGVYIMKNVGGDVIYVGKAISLKRRVTQYFRASAKPAKVQAMVDHVDDLDYVLTLSEADALTLEATLIKKYMPRYNILLKDDKGGGMYVRIDFSQVYPTLELTRKRRKGDGKYYGPYPSAGARAIVSAIRSAYGVRACRKSMKGVRRECLDYHIGLCLAPCTGKTDETAYSEALGKAVAFLSGKSDEVRGVIEEKMRRAAEAEDFERAMAARDMIGWLDRVRGRSMEKLFLEVSVDAVGYYTDGLISAVSVMPVRGNKLLAAESFPSEDASEASDALTNFLMQYYASRPVPDEIYVSEETDDALCEWLRKQKGGAVKLLCPKKGIKRDIVKTAEENARECAHRSAAEETKRMEQTYGACQLLCRELGLSSAHRMECYDISHISGTDKVASGVCFIDGAKAAREYRRYRIKTVEGNDDFHCMAEVLGRRLARAAQGDEKFAELPDLIVIDGGKGQLSAAQGIMHEAGFDLPMIGLAKREEEIFCTERSEPIRLSRDSAALKLLQRIRDEAHRFAITYHRNTRIKRIRTRLTDIEGVGEKKADLLLKAFGSMKNIATLPIDAIEGLQGMDAPTATKVYEYFHPEARKDNDDKI